MDVAVIENLLEQRQKPKGPKAGWKEKLTSLVGDQVKFEEALKRYTWIQIGGPAEALVIPQRYETLVAALEVAREYQVPWTVLGNGSNVLVRDGGIRGIVFRLHKVFNDFQVLEEDDEKILLQLEAGVPLPKLVEMGRQKGFEHIEFLYGIPGTVGGALWMNAGTRQGEIKEFVQELRLLNLEGQEFRLPASKLKFEYRHLKLPKRGILLGGRFCFKKVDPEIVQKKIKKVQTNRHETQPLDMPSLGSVFKNPEKGFAAQMIEELNLKGVRVGGARISPKHANFIVNERDATAQDVLVLVGLIRDKVKEELGVKLELEIKVLGEEL